MGELRERAWVYIASARRALEGLEKELPSRRLPVDVSPLLDAAKRYIGDAEYYYARGDYATALAAASYAEGLIDALKYLGLAEPRWPERRLIERRVFLGGTFDIVHPGHVELFRAASMLGKPYVVVARDSTVRRIKGKEPVLPEEARLAVVSSIRYVYEAFLGSERSFMESVARVKPDVILLGPDQPFDEEELASQVERELGYRPEVVRFEEKRAFAGGMRSSSDIVARICRGSYCRLLDR